MQEVAAQCLMEAFGIESMDKCTEENAIKPLTLPVVFHTGVQVLMGSGSNDAAKNVPEDSQQVVAAMPMSTTRGDTFTGKAGRPASRA